MITQSNQFTVLHGKFAAYLSWSQPFLYALLCGLEPHCRNVVLCNRTENLDRFPFENIVRLKTRYLVRPSGALKSAVHLSRNWQPDVLHGHFGWSGIRLLLLKQFLQVPLVTTFGGKDVGTQMRLPHYDRLYDLLLKVTDQIICVSADLKRQLVERGVDEDRIEVIRRGTDLQRFRFVDRSDRSPDKPVQLLMVGRLVEKKGHRYAFEAIARLRNNNRKVQLTVVGEGDDYSMIRRLRNRLGLQEAVQFASATDHAGVRRMMEQADAFVHCSVTGADGDCEGIPNVIVEAAATGLPIVGTRHGGIVEAIRHEETGLLVDEADVDALTAAIDRLVASRETRLVFGEAGARFMRREFDLQRQVERHVGIYERLVAAQRDGQLSTPQYFVPADFPTLIANTMKPGLGVREFSLAELGEWMLGPGKITEVSTSPRRTVLQRCYNLKGCIPQQIKYPVKSVLGWAMAAAIDRLNTVFYRRAIDRLHSDDQSVLEYFQKGGRIDQPSEPADEKELPSLIHK